jgi:hypothetical protein
VAPWEFYRVEAALTTAPDEFPPAWTDVTGYVEAWDVQAGRATEADGIEPSRLTVVLNNADHRFTPGNTTSPLYPYWRHARRLRVVEVLGYQSFPVFDGYIEEPDVDDWAACGDQIVSVTAIDRPGRMDRAPAFISTLGAHVLGTAAGLQAYYPMGDAGAPLGDRSGNSREGLRPVETRSYLGTATTPTGRLAVDYAAELSAPGDDLPGARLSVPVVAIPGLFPDTSYALQTTWGTPVTLAAGQTVTVVVWVTPNEVHAQNWFAASLYGFRFFLQLRRDSVENKWMADAFDFDGTLSLEVLGDLPVYGKAYPVAMQYGWTPNTLKLWVDADEYTGTPVGTGPASEPFTDFAVGRLMDGVVGHAQVYVGDYTHDDFLAQREVGRDGLDGQRTDERVATVASYAGIPATELVLDRGAGYMQQAALAGKRPIEAMREAATTEQGRLVADGDGRLVFHSRTRIYNV